MPATDVTVDLEEEDNAQATHRDERGQGMVEYAFILVLVAMVVLVSVVILGKQTSNLYSNIASGLGP